MVLELWRYGWRSRSVRRRLLCSLCGVPSSPASVPVIRDLVILPGQGGHGGNGGPGGVGGKGGAGGLGGKDGAGQDIMFAHPRAAQEQTAALAAMVVAALAVCGGPSYGLFVHGAGAGLISGYKLRPDLPGHWFWRNRWNRRYFLWKRGQDGAAGQAAEYNF